MMPNRKWLDVNDEEWISVDIPHLGYQNHRRQLVAEYEDIFCADYESHVGCVSTEAVPMNASQWIADRFGIPVMERKDALAVELPKLPEVIQDFEAGPILLHFDAQHILTQVQAEHRLNQRIHDLYMSYEQRNEPSQASLRIWGGINEG